MTIIFILPLDVSMHTIHFDWALRLAASLISLCSPSLCLSIMCVPLYVANYCVLSYFWKLHTAFDRILMEKPVMRFQSSVKSKKKYYHKTVASQCCAQRALKRQLIFMPGTTISYMKTSFGFSFGGGKNAAFIHRVLPSFYNCSLSSLLLLCVHLSPFHNKQTRQSMKSTATTEKSDKRNVMKYIFRLFFPRLSVFIAFAASCNCIQCPNMETIPHFLYDNDTKTMSEHQQRIVRE